MTAAPGMAGVIRAMQARPDRDYTFAGLDGSLRTLPFPELGSLAGRLGAGLAARGLRPGTRIALVTREPFDSVRGLFAAFAAGLVPVLAYPPQVVGDHAAYFEHLDAQLASAGVEFLLLDTVTLELLRGRPMESRWQGRLLDPALLPEGDPSLLPDPDAQDATRPALMQFTSGSGGLSKAVLVTHANLLANSRAILVDGLGIGPEDRAVSWLPLYHDMGLIGHVVAPACEGLSVTLYPTLSFLKRPGMWMDALSRHRGTITFAPNFAFGLAARARPSRELDLSRVRVLGCGAEPIQADVLRAFVASHAPFGLAPEALFPCYGMAEHTLAASFPRVGEGLRTAVLSADVYRKEGRAVPARPGEDALEFVSCGRAFPGHAIAIRPAGSDQDAPEGAVGEIVLAGPSVAAGYSGRDDETRKAFSGGFLRTGDLGFLHEGNLYVTGRIKDLIIVNGRNFDPQHVEAVVEGIPAVRAGSAFAFSVPGRATEGLVILYETRQAATEAIGKAIRAAVASALGITPVAVEARNAQTLPKTTSGKKRRALAREDYLKAFRREPQGAMP